jgi:cysteine desulfurase
MEHITYLDNAATTRIRPEVRAAIAPFLDDRQHFGNPSSSHRIGRTVRAAVEDARQRVADALRTPPSGVVFTSGGTEADNLAVSVTALAATRRNQSMRVAVSSTEHKAVLDAASAVESLGGESHTVPVDSSGVVSPDNVKDVLRLEPAILSVMWVNNETGVTQNIAELATICTDHGAHFHTDAVQAVGKVPCDLSELPGVLVTISGHKIGAPKGIGALIIPEAPLIEPLLHGGGQQLGVRPGTENVIGIVALGIAVELAVAEQEKTSRHTELLRDELEDGLRSAIPHIQINGASRRAPHISNISFPGADGASILMHLDQAGICCSSGSACNTGAASYSHVLGAMGVSPDSARSAVRFSFAHDNTMEDVDRVIAVMPDIVQKLRSLNGAAP